MFDETSLQRFSWGELRKLHAMTAEKMMKLVELQKQFDITRPAELTVPLPPESREVYDRYWASLSKVIRRCVVILQEIERRKHLIGNEITDGI